MTYPGGKNGAGVYQTIINQIPPHRVLIEPFAGSAGITRNIVPAASTILVDLSKSALAMHDSSTAILVEGCGIEYLENYDFCGDEFVYLDPPYVRSARKSARDLYEYEMADGQHRRLLRWCQDAPCKVAISGYQSDMYTEALGGWRLVTFTAQTRRGPVTEYLWMNYPEPFALHDYRYLGDDFRERERIKRKADRWVKRFEKLPELEMRGILSAILARRDLASSIMSVIDQHQKQRGRPDLIVKTGDRIPALSGGPCDTPC